MKRLTIVLVIVSIAFGFCVGYAVHQNTATASIESTLPTVQSAQKSATQ